MDADISNISARLKISNEVLGSGASVAATGSLTHSLISFDLIHPPNGYRV